MKLKPIVGSLVLLGLAGHVLAQTATQKIEITGSSIRRIQTEGALPIQTISRAELDRQGIVNAEQLIATLSINGNGLDNLASNADVVAGAARGNNGSTSANLRNQGANATLILLNGRRVAAHGVNGGVVDLNQIPMAAVDRVEILKDGASSIYGTDAVGGVINFILRRDYAGFRASASTDTTQHKGGNIYRAAVVGGLGNVDTDGYNVLATLSVTDAKRLDANQRDWVTTFDIDRGLSPDTRGTPFATLFLPSTTATTPVLKNVLTRPGQTNNTVGPLYNGATLNSVNTLDLPGAAGCASQPGMGPYAEKLWNSAAAAPASQLGCAYDTGRAVVIQQPVKNTNLVTRGSIKIGQQLLIGEWLLGRSESAKAFSENQISSGASNATVTLPNLTTVASPFRDLAYPSTGAGYDRVFNALVAGIPALEANRGLPMTFRWRCMACGQRQYDTTTDTGRLLLAMEGQLPWLGDWDYRVGASQAYSKSKSILGNGYHNWVGLAKLINNGTLNPFLLNGETQSAAAMAGLDAISARGTTLYGGKYTTNEVDMTLSGPVGKMPGGDALAAFGIDLRQEKYKFNGNTDVNTNDINTWIFNAAFDNVNALSGVKRNVKAAFGELILPLTKTLEANLSGRVDRYDGFGTTTNPKLSLRFAAFDSLVLRGSYSTGFRVPTFNQLYNGVTDSPNTGAGVPDPLTCPSGVVSNAPGCAAITFNTFTGGKRELGPETSKMGNVGFVWQPLPEFSATVDWWDIDRTGTIQTFSLSTLLANYTLFQQNFLRDQNGVLRYVDLRWTNAGQTITRGVELSLRGNLMVAGGRLTAGLDGSYLRVKKARLRANTDFGPSEVGVFTRSSELGIRWKHSAFVSYSLGDFVGSLRQQYVGGYAAYVPPGVLNGNLQPPLFDYRVKPYTLYHASVSYAGIKDLTLTVGVKNLFDKNPPFANNYDTNLGTGSNWEPRVADPRGRSFLVSADYKFF